MPAKKKAAPQKTAGVTVGATREARAAMDDQTWWKPKAGEGSRWGYNYIRIMPPNLEGKLYLGVPLHFGVGPSKAILPCPRKAFSSQCPVCEYGFALIKGGREEEGKDILPSWVGYMNIVELDEDGNPLGDNPVVKTWSASRGIIDDIISILEEQGDPTDLETGFDICVKRRGTGPKDTKYQTSAATKPSKFSLPELAENCPDLTLISPYVDQSIMQAALDGSAVDPMKKVADRQEDDTPAQIAEKGSSRFAEVPDEDGEPPSDASDEKSTEAQSRLRDAVAKDGS